MKLIGLLLLCLTFSACNSQKEELPKGDESKDSVSQNKPSGAPQLVINAFQEKYPGAQSVRWEKAGESFEATYTVEGVEFDSEFDINGKWLNTEKAILLSEIPTAVQQSLKTNYAGFVAKEAESVESAEHGNIFEINIVKGKESIDVIFDKSGKVISVSEGENDNGEGSKAKTGEEIENEHDEAAVHSIIVK